MKVPMPEPNKDPINPDYYNGDDVMQVIERYDLDFCTGNAIKYILRAGKKGEQVQDLKKALWYLERKIGQIEERRQ